MHIWQQASTAPSVCLSVCLRVSQIYINVYLGESQRRCLFA